MPKLAGVSWKATGWFVEPPNSRAAMSLIGAIGAYSASARFAWRGMSSADYDLSSSLQREVGYDATEHQTREAERKLIRAAREWGLGRRPSGYVDDLQLLSDLQHYGIRTRLIDFTSNPMTALWFACQSPKQDKSRDKVSASGVLLALNRAGWDEASTIPAPAPFTWDTLSAGESTEAWLEKLLQKERFVVTSFEPNERLRAQEGFFIGGPVPPIPRAPFRGFAVSYTQGDPVELEQRLQQDRGRGNPANVPFVAVIIKANLKRKLLRYLDGTYNRSAKVLFPDFAGFREFENIARPREGVADNNDGGDLHVL
jgi:hypothetical protein